MTYTLRLILLAVVLLAPAIIAEAQQAKRIFRSGYLSAQDPILAADRVRAIPSLLRERGYIEGQNITIEYRYAERNVNRLPGLAAELVRLKVDVIIAGGGDAIIRAAKNATKRIPIVLTGGGADPVEAGFVESLARPGGNITGITSLSRELGEKRLEILKEVAPKLDRVAVLNDPAATGSTRELKEDLPAAAQALKLTIQPHEIRTADDIDKVFAALNKHRPDGLYVLGGTLLGVNRKRIIDSTAKTRLPAVYQSSESVEAGGLMSYAADPTHGYQRVAYYVDRILKGTKPTDLPVEQPTKFELVINLKTAKQIRLEIPQWTLMKADRVIR